MALSPAVTLLLALSAAPQPSPSTDAGVAAASPALTPYTELPYSPSLDLADMNPTVDPCVDFYAYSCGGWQKAHPIPNDRASWDVYSKLSDDTVRFMWGILEEAAAKPAKSRTPVEQKIGDAFASCIDEAAVEAKGDKPLRGELAEIAKLGSLKQLPALLGKLHLTLADQSLLFGMGVAQDYGDSTRIIGFTYAGGLGLPDRDYYTKTDAKSVEIRARYAEYIATVLTLIGEQREAATTKAKQILDFETELAKASLTRVEQRDPHNLHHLLPLKDVQALTPKFDWAAYLKALGKPGLTELNVTEPAFFKALDAQLGTIDLAVLKTYLAYQLTRARSNSLSKAFVDSRFEFFSKYLRGVVEKPPRWKRCVELVDRDLGEALAQAYVKKTFGPDVKSRTLDMTKRIEQAMEDDLNTLSWMSPVTRKAALEKLKAIRNKVGYPDAWRDYSSLSIVRGDFAGNSVRSLEFENRRQLNKIGKPIDHGEWQMTPPTVNAYYDAQMNDINFPAGVLQPPLFDFKMDDAPNYGNTGATIGHELTHGFDDEGRQFDGNGNLRDWWTEADAKEFETRAQCVVDQYAQYVIVDDIKINSKLTLGEDVADLGGTVLAWNAWKKAFDAANAGKKVEKRDGFTPEQRFFIGYGQWACENERPENARAKAITNPHSPGRYRINGVVANMPEFQAAFACKAGSPMVRAKPCRVW